MEVKKFEAYHYKGPTIDKIDRKKFLDEIYDLFSDGQFIGYDINGTSYKPEEEVLYIYLAKKESNGVFENRVIKLDFSDLGIEIGSQEWNEEKEEYDEFIPEINLDTEQIKQMKDFKRSTKNYNI